MALKYRFTFKDFKKLSLEDFKIYLFSLFKAFIPHKKIKNLLELKIFIQNKSAWVSQVTLYGYLKTRMGSRYVLHFDNEIFLRSINTAKWNVYVVALQDLTFFTFSYLHASFGNQEFTKAENIFNEILEDEIQNNIPNEVAEEAKRTFKQRLEKINWKNYYESHPFNDSALALYKWAPIADELKILDRKIVLNSVILKWDIVKKEFYKRINF